MHSAASSTGDMTNVPQVRLVWPARNICAASRSAKGLICVRLPSEQLSRRSIAPGYPSPAEMREPAKVTPHAPSGDLLTTANVTRRPIA